MIAKNWGLSPKIFPLEDSEFFDSSHFTSSLKLECKSHVVSVCVILMILLTGRLFSTFVQLAFKYR